MNYSILVTVYNDANYLPRCFDSLLSQTLLPQEIVVVNDNSTDETSDVIKKYGLKEIYSSEPKHEGRWLNRVRAFKLGLTSLNPDIELVLKVDADIIIEPDYAATVLTYFTENPNLAACSGVSNRPQFNILPRNGAIMYRKEYLNPDEINEVYAWDRWILLWCLERGYSVNFDETVTYEELRDSILTFKEVYNAGQVRRREQYPLRGVLLQFLLHKGWKKIAFINGYLSGGGELRHNSDFIRQYSKKEEAQKMRYILKRFGTGQ